MSQQSFVIFIPSGHGGQFTVSKAPPALNTNVGSNRLKKVQTTNDRQKRLLRLRLH